MTTTTKRPARTTVEAITARILDEAAGPMPIPAHIHLRPRDRPYFDAVIAARPRYEWHARPWLVPLASQAAFLLGEIAAERRQLATESKVVVNRMGRSHANPRINAITTMTAHALRLLRALRIVGSRAALLAPLLDIPDDDLIAH